MGFTIAYVDRANLSIALASPQFSDDFGLSNSDRGLLNSAFFWSYALLQIPCGLLTDRYGVKRPYAIAFALWSVVSALTALAADRWHLFALRVLLGAGEAIATPASISWIATHIDEKHRGLAVGILFSGAKFGPAISAHVSVQLLQNFGWRWMFAIVGVGSLLFLVPWLLLVKDDGRIRALRVAPPGSASPPGALWRSPIIYGALIGSAAYNYFTCFNLTWLPAYFVDHCQLSLESMGVYTAFSFLGMAAVSIAGGALADWLIGRGARPIRVRKAFTVAGLAIASLQIVGVLDVSREVAVAAAIISMAGSGLITANYWALIQRLTPGASIGRISGLQNLVGNLAGILAPALTGWLLHASGSYNAPFTAVLAALVMGIIAYLFMVRQKSPQGWYG